ncbi:MAG TPA: urease accessory protein UreD [Myxococcales bacterium]|nr:urease accessory protein UreD [Myxococcales bacterium]
MPRVAQGHLAFERAGAGTAVRTAYAESPLRLLTPRNHGGAAWAYTSTLGGGLVDGDRVRVRIEVGAGARALVTTQGPTRVFRSPGGCESETAARVEEGALLALLPAPAACFSGARFQQRTSLDLAAGASLAFWDVLSSGRDGWDFARCRSAISLRREGRALLEEAWLLDAAHGPVRERFGRFQAIGTLVLAGPLLDAGGVREAVDARPLLPGARLLKSASPLGSDALVVRLAAERVEILLAALREHLGALRAALGDDPWRLDAPHAA